MLCSKPLAIIGAACRLPGAPTFPAFADLLLSGRSAIQDIPGDRWTKSRYFHPVQGQAGKTYSFAAGALAEIYDFDPGFFGISAREATSIDPQQRLTLELAYEAMEDAGLPAARLFGTATGVFVGASSWDFAAVSFADAAALDTHGMQGAALSSVANRVSYVFGLRGPSLTVDTACSSSLVALHLACEALQRDEVGQAIVGGVNLLMAPQSFVGFARASMLSRLGRCHSFDARADGYVRGEGGGAIIVKPLANALADGDPIRAVIRATGVNSDGRTNGFSMPSGAAQADLVREVCARAGVTADEFRYFEAHGTGTPVGDPIEARAIGEAVGQGRTVALPIGSVKSNIGHLEAASGMAGLLKLLVCLEHDVIPASLNFEVPNPQIQFDELNLEVVTQPRPLGGANGPGLVGINSFGFGGTNGHAILAGPPPFAPPPSISPPSITRPSITPPSITRPDIGQPEITRPDISRPEITAPEITRPAITRPDLTPPEITRPDVIRPEITRPDIDRPEVIRPDVTRPDITRPEVIRPDVTQPDITRPEVIRPDVTPPYIAPPDLLPPGEIPPDASPPDVAPPAGQSGLSAGDEIGRPAGDEIGMPLLVSARSFGALQAMAGAWRDTLAGAPARQVAALLRGAARSRDQHPHRLAVTGSDAAELAVRLDQWLADGRADGVAVGQADGSGVAFVYSGNGSQWAGMGLDALRTNAAFAGFLAEVDDHLAPGLGWSVVARLRSDDLSSTIRYTTVAQPLMFATQVAVVSTLRAAGVRPAAHVGHSAGEVAAAWGSGALTLRQACHVIIHRSLLQGATHGVGGMASLALGETAANALIARLGPAPVVGPLAVGAINSTSTVTVSGAAKALEQVAAAAHEAGVHFSRLDLDYAFHSPAMDPIRLPLLAALDGLVSGAPCEKLVSTVTGDNVSPGELTADYWWRNVRLPVRFGEAVARLIRDGVRNFLEIGPQPVLQHYLRDALRVAGEPGRVMTTLSRRAAGSDALALAAAECHVAGADITAAACFDGPAEVRGLPRYPFQRQRYAATRSTEAIEVVAPVDDHPLLGFRDPASRDAWMSHLSTAAEPWLADHVVDGAVVLPAAAIIEMALAAARVRHPEAASLEIQDLELTRALVLEPGAVRDCRTTVTPDGHWQLASRPRLSQEATQAHAAGRILPGLGGRPVLAGMRAGAGDLIDAATVYARARTLRLNYGPAFQTVTGVHRVSASQGVADLAPCDDGRMAAGYLLDPAVLDGSLQALLALAAGDPAVTAMGAVLPWRFGRVRLLRAAARPVRSSLHISHIGPRSIRADIGLTDAAGETVAELLDCWFVAMPAASPAARDQTFWTAYVPSARQPAVMLSDPGDRVIAAAAGIDELPEAMLLADACAAAIAHEALLGLSEANRLPASLLHLPLVAATLPWLVEDGLAAKQADGPATKQAGGWMLAEPGELPAAAEIWRSLFFGTGEGAADCVLLAALGPSLGHRDTAGLQLSPALREQALFASPTAREAMAALLRGLDAFTATWPAGRCLRVAVVGALHATLLRDVQQRIVARGLPLRLVALAAERDALAVAEEVLAQTPAASTLLWPAIQDDGFDGCDLVLDLYGLSLPSRERVAAGQLLRLLAPGGLLLAAEPVPNRAAALLFGPGIELDATAALRHPEAWCMALRDAGFATARHTLLDGAIWPASLLVASAAVEPGLVAGADASHEQGGLVVFAAPNDRLAAALAARQRLLHLLPIESLREVLTAPFAARQQHVLLLASETTEDEDRAEALAELLADISTALQGMAPPQTARLWLVSGGSPAESLVSAALTGLRRVAANELPGLDCRSIALDSGLPDAECAVRVLQELAEPDDEAEVIWRVGGRMVPRLRAGLADMVLESGPRRLEVGRPGLIGSLAWVSASPAAPGAHDVAIEVHASALNFRDVMWAQGLLPDEALIDGFSGASLGLECAGVVTAVGEGVDDLRPGDRVAAVAPAALATHVVTRRNGVMRIPAGMSFAAAATIPVAFMTAVYSLGHLAHLDAGETVLIHGGAGGVGLAAIQYALHKGAVVYATAGSEMRRQTLRMLGAAAVFDSRDTSFVDEVLLATGGQGVDVVLNSVSHELMKQSLRLLRPFGRFLEIGKRDLYRDTAIGIRSLRHNASYSAIDLDELVASRPAVGLRVLNEVADLLEAGQLGPLPYRAFGFGEAVAAFRLLQASGHVGKVVLLPEPTRSVTIAPRSGVRAGGVYVVTGGLTGFGLETARWLVRQGAGGLALIGRRGGATPGCERVLAELRQAGADVKAFACDVAEPAELEPVLCEIRRTMGPIAGVMHAAMVLDDAPLHELDAARFAMVIRPKLAGALALDRLTRGDPIALFVLFSSVATVIGTPGQASYVAANRALEALAERRHAEGLPALAVQWGPIGDAGYLVRETRVSEMLAGMLGSTHLRASQALAALPALLASGRPVIGLADVAWGELRGRLPGLAGSFWSEMPARDHVSETGQSLSARLAQLTPHEATTAVQEILVEEIARVLQQPASTIGIHQPIHEFGVDSLMAVELQTALEVRLGLQIPLTVLTGAATLHAIAGRLVAAIDKPDTLAAEDDVIATILRHESEPVAGVAAYSVAGPRG